MDALGKLISNLNSKKADFQRFFWFIIVQKLDLETSFQLLKQKMVQELTTDQKLIHEALESGEDATQKLKNVINNLVNSEDADKRTPLQKAVEKSDIGKYRSPKNVEAIHTKFYLFFPCRSGKIFD